MKKKADKFFALLLAACLTATVATTSAFAFNRTDFTAPAVSNMEETSSEPTTPSEPPDSSSSQPDESSSEPEPPSSSEPEPPSSSEPEPPSSSEPEPPSSSEPEPSSSSQPELPDGNAPTRPVENPSSQSESSRPTAATSESSSNLNSSNNLLPGTGSHTLSEVNSYDWDELLSNINSDGSAVSTDEEAGGFLKDDRNGGNGGGSWLLIGGIALIVIALGGIGFVVFTQIRAHKTQVSDFPISGAGNNTEITGDTIAFDPIGGNAYGDDYGDDYDYSDEGKVTPEQASSLFHESTDINSYSQPEVQEAISDPIPEDSVEFQNTMEQSVIEEQPAVVPESSVEPEVLPMEDVIPAEPEEIFSDSSMQKSIEDTTSFQSEDFTSSPKKDLDDENPFDMYFKEQKGTNETENQSPSKQIGDQDDFWDQFFKS